MQKDNEDLLPDAFIKPYMICKKENYFITLFVCCF